MVKKNKLTKKQLTMKKNMLLFPKIELHRHLEGTFDQKTLFKVARKNNLNTPPSFSDFKKRFQFPKDSGPDFLKFLSMFKNDWYRSHEDVYEIAYNSTKNLSKDGIFYIELRFSPEHFALHNDFSRIEITSLVINACNKAAEEEGFQIRYLLTFNRSKQTNDEMVELYNEIKKQKIPGIVGIDLAGDEIHYPPELFEDFFNLVQEDGLYKATIHAGEVSPPEQIWDSINTLHAKRIGHGTSSITDEKLQDYLLEKNISLEQCITSNFQTGSWPDETNHPLGRLYKKGVPVTINSDDPSIQNTDLTEDYIKAVKFFDFTIEDLINLNLIAIDTAFLSEQEKTTLKTEYLQAVENWHSFVSRETK